YLAVSVVPASLFGWAASRFFIEARRNGELEVLLTTPLGAKTIVSSQLNWLKRLLFWPLVVLVAPGLVFAPLRWMVSSLPNSLLQLLMCVNIIIGNRALLWVGIWLGLKV